MPHLSVPPQLMTTQTISSSFGVCLKPSTASAPIYCAIWEANSCMPPPVIETILFLSPTHFRNKGPPHPPSPFSTLTILVIRNTSCTCIIDIVVVSFSYYYKNPFSYHSTDYSDNYTSYYITYC